jgi:hypothetical protein
LKCSTPIGRVALGEGCADDFGHSAWQP